MRALCLLALLISGCAAGPPKPDQAQAPATQATQAPADLVRNWREAMSLHMDQKWAESNARLEENLRFLEKQPHLNLGHETFAFLLSDSIRAYKGDHYELVTAHTLGMLNFAMMGKVEEALVEARRADLLLGWMKDAGAQKGEDPFCRLVSAKLYQAAGMLDDAYIDLLKAREGFQALSKTTKIPEPSFLGDELWALAKRTGRKEEEARWEKKYALEEKPKGAAEIWVLVYHASVPPLTTAMFGTTRQNKAVWQPSLAARIHAGGATAKLEPITDFASIAKQALKERNAAAGFRAIGRTSLRLALAVLVTVVAVAAKADPDPEMYEAILNDKSGDTRAWDNLPAQVYAARLWLKPGSYELNLEADVGGTIAHIKHAVKARKNQLSIVRFSTGRHDNPAAANSPSAQP